MILENTTFTEKSEKITKIRGAVLDILASKNEQNAVQLIYGELVDNTEGLSNLPTKLRGDGEIAVSPQAALHCFIKDYKRTAKFIRGIYKAIQEKKALGGNKPIQIWDVGSGPIAGLTLPLTTLFTHEDIEITCLDIHKESIDKLQKVVEALGLGKYFREFISDDATNFQIEGEIPDIIVSETMNRGMIDEPIAQIMVNLGLQCGEDTVLIPGNVSIRAYLKTTNSHNLAEAQDLGEVASLREMIQRARQMILEGISRKKVINTSTLIDKNIVTPKQKKRRPQTLYLGTTVQVFGEEVIGEGDSVITGETFLRDLGFGSNVEWHIAYQAGTTRKGISVTKNTY